MLYYPQLTTGAVVAVSSDAQVPTCERLPINCPAAITIRMADHRRPEGSMAASIFKSHRRRAVLHRKSVRSFRRSAETFTFLDPADNLLMWSEDWTQDGVDGRSIAAG